MVFDRLAQWRTWFRGEPWEQAFSFIETLGPDTPDGRTELDGEALYALVMSYPTIQPAEAVLETHDRHIDIQCTLRGAEGMLWWPRKGLDIREPYNAERDRTFYVPPEEPAPCRVDVGASCFAVFFPADAHMPQLAVGDRSEVIRKVVVKVRTDLVRP